MNIKTYERLNLLVNEGLNSENVKFCNMQYNLYTEVYMTIKSENETISDEKVILKVYDINKINLILLSAKQFIKGKNFTLIDADLDVYFKCTYSIDKNFIETLETQNKQMYKVIELLEVYKNKDIKFLNGMAQMYNNCIRNFNEIYRSIQTIEYIENALKEYNKLKKLE